MLLVEPPSKKDSDPEKLKKQSENQRDWNGSPTNFSSLPQTDFDWDQLIAAIQLGSVIPEFEELFISGGNGAFPLSETVVDTIESLAENRLPAVLKERFRDDPKRMETYDFDSGGCKMVLSLREDFLPLLERFRQRIPKIFYNRIRLEPLDGENAWDVILQPSADLVDEPTALVILNAAG
jgi:hypothetical protein